MVPHIFKSFKAVCLPVNIKILDCGEGESVVVGASTTPAPPAVRLVLLLLGTEQPLSHTAVAPADKSNIQKSPLL